MTNNAITEQLVKNVWQDTAFLDEIKKVYGKGLNEIEFATFMMMAKSNNLNPFNREIFSYKFGDAATIVIARDGYRKIAQRHPEYDYHMADAVYSGDTFEQVDGKVKHAYNMADRGALVGAYALAKRKSSSLAHFTFVNLKEYIKQTGTWKTIPATMIKKVAESQVLRMAFQESYVGTYDESEIEGKDSAIDINPETGELLSANN